MDIAPEKKQELLEKLKGMLSRLHGGEFSMQRLQAMAEKAKVAREEADAPRKSECFGGIFKYPPVESPEPAEGKAEGKPEEVPKTARCVDTQGIRTWSSVEGGWLFGVRLRR